MLPMALQQPSAMLQHMHPMSKECVKALCLCCSMRVCCYMLYGVGMLALLCCCAFTLCSNFDASCCFIGRPWLQSYSLLRAIGSAG
jgi:hypothetical protein